MLAAQQRLRKDSDIKHVFKSGRRYSSALLRISVVKNPLPYARFTVVTSKQVAKLATERNAIKRRVRAAIREQLSLFLPGYDIVILAQAPAKGATYKEIQLELSNLAKKAKVYA